MFSDVFLHLIKIWNKLFHSRLLFLRDGRSCHLLHALLSPQERQGQAEWKVNYYNILYSISKGVFNFYTEMLTLVFQIYFCHDDPWHQGQESRIEILQVLDTDKGESLKGYWGQLGDPLTIQEYGAIHTVHMCPTNPSLVACTAYRRVQVYNMETIELQKTISKFKDLAFSGRWSAGTKRVGWMCSMF